MNRQTARKAIAALMSANLTGAGKPLQKVYDYKAGDIKGESPVAMVLSAGSDRPVWTAQGRRAIFDLEIWVFVLYADPESGSREKEAEDQVDDIEYATADLLCQAEHEGMALDYRGKSVVRQATIGGATYLWEVIPIQASVVR